jgi:hypothetical protein
LFRGVGFVGEICLIGYRKRILVYDLQCKYLIAAALIRGAVAWEMLRPSHIWA